MTVATPFSSCLAQTRASAGFKTAYEFYTKSGRRKVLNLSWVAYRKMEKGMILPKPERLSLLVSLLGLPHGSPQVRELVRSYLRTSFGSEQAYHWIMGMASGPQAPAQPSAMGERAISRAIQAETHKLSHEQDQAIIAGYASYWSFMVLCGGVESWKISDLAAKLGVAKGELLAALRRLERAKVVEFLEDGVRCPLADKRVQLFPQAGRPAKDLEKISQYHARMTRKRGTLLSHAYSLPRANELELANYYPHLDNAVKSVHVFSRHQRAAGEPPTPLFLVEGLVYRLSL